MPKLPRIEGCLTAIVTPLSGGKVDFKALEKLVDWQIENGVDGIVSVGTTGESATLDVEEHVAVIAATVKAARGRVPVVRRLRSSSLPSLKCAVSTSQSSWISCTESTALTTECATCCSTDRS